MEIALHYSARLRTYRQLDELIEEVAGLAKEINWPFSLVDEKKLKGIVLTPRKCDPFYFCFTKDGRTCCPEKIKTRKPTDEFFSKVHVTTMWAGSEVHMGLTELLRYVSEKYFAEISVLDEAGYWKHWNKKDLRYAFGKIEHIGDIILENHEWESAVVKEPPDSIAARVERLIRERKDGS